MRDVTLKDCDTKRELPIHMMLGISDYKKIKTPEKVAIGLLEELIAELTKLGWYILSLGKENDITNVLCSKTSIHDYENLCSLDFSGVLEKQDKRDDYVFKKFKEQLGRVPGEGGGGTMKSGKRIICLYKIKKGAV